MLAAQHSPKWLWAPILVFVLVATSLAVVPPGQTSVVQFFGRYIGTVRRPGFWWVLAPLTVRRGVSVRVRNFETSHLKVNDADGNPVEIAAIVVWQVADTAKATYAVDSYQNFVSVQAESALRHVATSHPYDDTTGTGTSLRGSTDVVSGQLADEVAERVAIAGVEIVEVRISHLAYAQEIAQAMLRRQQANAVVAARSRIVEGAVGMVEMALNRFSRGRRGLPRRGAHGQHGEQSDGRVVRGPAAVAGREHGFALYVSERRQVLLRIDPAVHDALMRWANDDLRSVNAQIEMLLRRALTDAGRMPKQAAPLPRRGRPPVKQD